MSFGKSTAYFLSLVLIFSVCRIPLYAQPAIDLKLTMNKEVYLEHEPLWAKLELINKREQSLKMYGFYQSDFSISIIITNSNGDTLPYKGFIASGWGEDTSYQLVDSIHYEYRNLEEYFGEDERNGFGDLYFPTGEYNIRLVGHERRILHSEGQFLESGVVSVRVIPPTGEEEIVTRDYQRILEARLKGELDEQERLCLLILDRYPTSIYAPKIFRKLKGLYKIQRYDRVKLVRIMEKWLNEHPDDPSMYDAILTWADLHRDPIERKCALQDLIRKYPNTMLSRAAEKSLQYELNKTK